MTTVRSETIAIPGRGEFTAHTVVPDAGSGPGLLIIQEIFGVSPYIKDVCDRVAALGYVAMAPDLYWRITPGVSIDEQDPDALQRAMGYGGRLDFEGAVGDAVASLKHLKALPEVQAGGGKAGVMGFCLGGGISYRVAAAADPACAISYYGSAVPDALGVAGDIHCPILFHFGLEDNYLTVGRQAAVREAFAGNALAEFHDHEGAGHAFDNHNSPRFSHPRAAAEAWEQTKDFLRQKLPV
ncbi:MAG TPA: dienelactone hydrolase family protein [Actinomycetota bacterium]|nr:dienelactone hydrolase family protein [Actinomycetota bacterium]